MLLVPSSAAAGSNMIFLCSYFVLALWSSVIFLLLFYLPSVPYHRSLLVWVDDEPALLVSHCLTHPLRGWGMVDDSRTETADRVARYQTTSR